MLAELLDEAAQPAAAGQGGGTGVAAGFDLMAVNLARLPRLPRLLQPLAAAAAALQWTLPEPEDASEPRRD